MALYDEQVKSDATSRAQAVEGTGFSAKGTGFSAKGTGFSAKGTGFSPYISPQMNPGL
jgi:hypothetical protein